MLADCAESLIKEKDFEACVQQCIDIVKSEVGACVEQLQSKLFALESQIKCEIGCLTVPVEAKAPTKLATALATIGEVVEQTAVIVKTTHTNGIKVQEVCTEAIRLLGTSKDAVDTLSLLHDDCKPACEIVVTYLTSTVEFINTTWTYISDLNCALQTAEKNLRAVRMKLKGEEVNVSQIDIIRKEIELMFQAVQLNTGVDTSQLEEFKELRQIVNLLKTLQQHLNNGCTDLTDLKDSSQMLLSHIQLLQGDFKAMLQGAVDDVTKAAQREMDELKEKFTCEVNNVLGEGVVEQLEVVCGALASPMFKVAKTWWAGKKATWMSEAWRARLQAAFSVAKVLDVLSVDHPVRRKLEKEVLHRLSMESSLVVRRMLKSGADVVASLSVERRVKDMAEKRKAEWKESWAQAAKELEDELIGDVDALAKQADQHLATGEQLSTFQQQKQALRHRQTRMELKQCSTNIADMRATFDAGLDRLQSSLGTKLEAIESQLKNIHEMLETLVRERNTQPQQQHGYYMYVALQRAPVISGTIATHFASEQQVSLIEKSLDARSEKWTQEGKCPIRFADLSEISIKSDLKDGACCVVWSGLGSGFDMTTTLASEKDSQPAAADKTYYPLNADKLVKVIKSMKMKPSVFVVALKYGAEEAARKLRHELDHISTAIVWVQADALPSTDLVEALRIAIDIVMKPDTESQAITDIRMESQNLTKTLMTNKEIKKHIGDSAMGCLLSKCKAAKMQWCPADKTQLIFRRVCNKTSLTDYNFLNELSRCHMQSCDLPQSTEVKQHLQEGRYHQLAIAAGSKEDQPLVYSRSQAVALDACASLVLDVHTDFTTIMRIVDRDGMQQAQELVEANKGSNRILLWADMQEAMPAVRKSDIGRFFSYDDSKKEITLQGRHSAFLHTASPFLDAPSSENRKIQWASGKEPRSVSRIEGRIVSVEEEIGGDVKLANGEVIKNPSDQSCWNDALTKDLKSIGQDEAVHIVATSSQKWFGSLLELQKEWGKWNFEKFQADGANADILKICLSPVDSDDSIKACAHHEEIRFYATLEGSDEKVDLMSEFDVDVLERALEQCLPGHRPIAALLRGSDANGAPMLLVRICISDIRYLHELRDTVLADATSDCLAKKLNQQPRKGGKRGGKLTVGSDLTQFAEIYEGSVLAVDTLTPHQVEKLAEVEEEGSHKLEAPAGAGKTFVALHRMQQLLGPRRRCWWERPMYQVDVYVLFVAKNKSLCLFVVRWMRQRYRHMPAEEVESQIMSRLHVLYHPLEQPMCCKLERSGTRASRITFHRVEEPVHYKLVVVDEAHHLYRNKEYHDRIERYANRQGVQRLLLSDVSQSHGRHIQWPANLAKTVHLTQVVRCSQRIVAGAMPFQLDTRDGGKKQDTMSQHKATGPPLKTFLFDVPPGEDRMRMYGEKTMQAIQDIFEKYPDLNLHNRLAILVSNVKFRDTFKELIERPLNATEGRTFKIISAEEASSIIDDKNDQSESVVLDTVANFDGLERLMVIGVDLDKEIEEDRQKEISDDKKAQDLVIDM